MDTETRDNPSSTYAPVIWAGTLAIDALVWATAVTVAKRLAPTCNIPLSIMLTLMAALLMAISLGAVIGIVLRIADRRHATTGHNTST